MKENNNNQSSNSNRLPAFPMSRVPVVPVSRVPAFPMSRMSGSLNNFFEEFKTLKNTESRWDTIGFTKES